jgi:dTDP-4-dehydrorhamnose 3,5-epimerase
MHTERTLTYACIFERIKLALYDDRPESPTNGALQEIFLDSDNHSLVVTPPGVWSGFKGMTDPFAIVANCCTHPPYPSRTTRLDPLDNDIPYEWATGHH